MKSSRMSSVILLVGVMLVCSLVVYRSAFGANPYYFAIPRALEWNSRQEVYRSPEELAPCGQICTYGSREVMSAAEAKSEFPRLEKDINCENIISRMAYRKHKLLNPPPEQPPADLYDQYMMKGDQKISPLYFNSVNMSRSHSVENVNRLIKKVLNNEPVSMYREGKCVQDTMRKYISRISDKHGVVIGTQKPWVEAILLAYNASKVTTLEYTNLTIDSPKVTIHTPYDFADMYLQGRAPQFDFGVTFSSLEHSGLGRYGDPLNPYGDLEAMAQVWCMTKPGGLFAVGLPVGTRDHVLWNAHRIYAKNRLPQMAANWRVEEIIKCADQHKLMILTKPT